MADIPPINSGAPVGAEPMKKSTGRVQPKKETVRINLPPKPTAAPTIKLPTLPPGGPTGASGVAPAVPGAPPLRSSAAPVAAMRTAAAAPAAASGVPSTTVPRKPVATVSAAATKISPLDKGLALAAAVLGLAAVGLTVWMMMILSNALNS